MVMSGIVEMKESSIFDSVRNALLPRYAKKDEHGIMREGWNSIFGRVAVNLGESSEERTNFYEMMRDYKFLPNSPCLMNAGTKYNMLAACFVLDMEDDSESIMKTTHDAVRIQRVGGGVGIPFHKLRSKGSMVKSSGGRSSGPVEFMRGMSSLFHSWQQGGRRRGAFMGTITSDHKDIDEFITSKNDNSKITNFNISVMMYNEDMEDGYLVEKIAQNSWVNGDPSMLFWDRINKDQPNGKEIYCTNPCAESPLEAYEACVLGSVNLSAFENVGELYDLVYDGVIFLNRMLDKSKYPLREIKDTVQKNRKIGLGIMGFHDLLLENGLKYGSPSSIIFAKRLIKNIRQMADKASDEGNFENQAVLSLAPTGSISLIADMCSSGIEPLFQGEFDRYITNYKTNSFDVFRFTSPYKDDEHFVDAHEVTWREHIDMQAAFQEHVDLSVSKTINVPHSFTVEDIIRVYKYAHQKGLKGVTVYRDQSKENQPIQKCEGDQCVL